MRTFIVLVAAAFLAGCASNISADSVDYQSGITGTKISTTNVKVSTRKAR